MLIEKVYFLWNLEEKRDASTGAFFKRSQNLYRIVIKKRLTGKDFDGKLT
jgi:hypothetical protein